MTTPPQKLPSALRLRRIGIDTYQQSVVYMHEDCSVCRAEGFEAQSRVQVHSEGGASIVALLNVMTGDWWNQHQAGLSEAAWHRLGAVEGTVLQFSHAPPAASASDLRAKVFGAALDRSQYGRLLRDAVNGRLSDIELAAFVTACAGDRLDFDETIALSQAMVEIGERIEWQHAPVLDKHCVGGLPGNRTTPIVVAIVAALGHWIPKTSSRAITSPAGTADVMGTMTEIELGIPAMRRVVEAQGGCLVWGGGAELSPADDVLIRIERTLDFDSDAQLTASVLSKKVAAGATHVLIDIPVGATAKVRSAEAANALAARLHAVGSALGLAVHIHLSDGSGPVGRGLGPALEANDVLAVLRGDTGAPADLRDRALDVAAAVVEMAPSTPAGQGRALAVATLTGGLAWAKFQAICEAQGGLREPPRARFQQPVFADRDAALASIDNRRLARLAKLAGAPRAAAAGLEMHVQMGTQVKRGDPILTLHTEAKGEMDYALAYYAQQADLLGWEARL